MKLYFSPTSPYSRKARIVAALAGFNDKIELVATDTNDPEGAIRTKNPLGKIPTLELDDGDCIFDSSVISQYLDDLAGGGKVIPRERQARFAALKLEALADGLTDATILQIYEVRMRAENERSAKWVDHQRGKVDRALDVFEAAPPPPLGEIGIAHVGAVALACGLGYLDLRFAGAWRTNRPRLVAWLESFAAAVPAYAATRAQ